MASSQPDSLEMFDSMEIGSTEEEDHETKTNRVPLNELSSDQLNALNPFRWNIAVDLVALIYLFI